MRSVVFAVIAVLGLFVAGFSQAVPQRVAASNEATPTPELPPGVSSQLCSEHQLAQGELVFRAPPGKNSGSVLPYDMSTQRLFLIVMTLPPGACISWREREGAVILVVQEGIIDYTAHYEEVEEEYPVLTGDSDDPDCVFGSPGCPTDDVDSDETISLQANDWVTQDRSMWYTFRNGGAEDATVSVASYVIPWDEDDPCNGNCRTP